MNLSPQATEPLIPAASEPPASILVVDDQRVNRLLLGRILSTQGYEVTFAANGEEVLQMDFDPPPDLILLDVVMDDLSGFDVCRELRGRPETQDTQIVFLTALGSEDDKVKGLDLGASDYITKPFSSPEVRARVRTQLRIQQLTRSLREKNRELEKKHLRIEQDLQAAAVVQQTLIPDRDRRLEGFEVDWHFLPCDSLGGDIFNFVELDERFVIFYLLDVSGHGVPSAMVTVSVAKSLAPVGGLLSKTAANGERLALQPALVLAELDREYPTDRFGKFFTITYVVLDRHTGEMRYSSAAHPPPVLAPCGKAGQLLEEGGPIIGLGEYLGYEEGRRILEPGDRFYLYSDGIVEHEGPKGLFGQHRLVDSLVGGGDRSLQEVTRLLLRSIQNHGRGASPADDVSLMAVEYTGRPGLEEPAS
ncbi:MAG: fused response regulator/phosphatase [Acidobacteriota bacterium]